MKPTITKHVEARISQASKEKKARKAYALLHACCNRYVEEQLRIIDEYLNVRASYINPGEKTNSKVKAEAVFDRDKVASWKLGKPEDWIMGETKIVLYDNQI